MAKRFSTIELASNYNDPYYFGLPIYGGRIRLTPKDRLLVEKGGSMGNSIELYLDLLTDNQVFYAIDKQLSEICSRPFYVLPGGKSSEDQKAASFCEEILKNLSATASDSFDGFGIVSNNQGFDGLTKGLGMCLLTGRTIAEIIWFRGVNNRPLIKEVKLRDVRRFIFETDEQGRNWLKLLTKSHPFDGIFVPARKFIVCRYWAFPSDDVYGDGIGRFLYYPVQWKRECLSLWLTIIDRHAEPTTIGKYPQEAPEQTVLDFQRGVSSLAREMSMTLPEDFSVDFAIASLNNAEILTKLNEWCDKAISKVILGEASTGEATPGSYSRESISNSIRVMKAKALSDLISETLNNTLMKWLTIYNYPGAKPPKVFRQFEDTADKLTVLNDLKQLGYSVSKEYLEDLFGIPLTDPAPKKRFV